jgi:RinA family phage transcriptional activator
LDIKQEIKRIRADILQSSGGNSYSNGFSPAKTWGHADPTGTTATYLTTHRHLEQLEYIVRAIEQVYSALPNERKKLVEVRYWGRSKVKTWAGIARKVNISERQAIRWRDEIVLSIAYLVGWR